MLRLLIALMLLAPSVALSQTLVGGSANGVGLGAASGGGDWAATFGSCTPGTDCFCDLIDTTGTVNAGYSNVIWCEDFDHDAFYETTPSDVNDAYGNNNWISTSGAIFGSGDRGGGSRWTKKYLDTDNGFTWRDGEPSTTCGGVITSVGGSGIGSGPKEYDKDDRWCANAYDPWIDILKTSADFAAENGSGAPTIPGSGGAVVFGDYALAHRNPRTEPAGYHTESGTTFGGDKSQLGITSAVGYEDNILSTDVLGFAWKHDEFSAANDGNANDGLFGFNQTSSPAAAFPYHGFIFGTGFTCSSAISGATEHVGEVACDGGGNMYWYADVGTGTGLYTWPDDFSLSSWHCMSAYWDFRDITSVSWKFWHNGELLIHISGVNLTGSYYDSATNGVDAFRMNNYANQASVASGGTGDILEATRRYTDNYVMRDGTPVLCEDLGFPASHNQAGL